MSGADKEKVSKTMSGPEARSPRAAEVEARKTLQPARSVATAEERTFSPLKAEKLRTDGLNPEIKINLADGKDTGVNITISSEIPSGLVTEYICHTKTYQP